MFVSTNSAPFWYEKPIFWNVTGPNVFWTLTHATLPPGAAVAGAGADAPGRASAWVVGGAGGGLVTSTLRLPSWSSATIEKPRGTAGALAAPVAAGSGFTGTPRLLMS